mmetsp:Transcript_40121/g.106117  ORF Transcript_40121/g.106117 Transcript_40121/m.106117 type:complete len:243 (+) Transcript_40121:895-1623(+)
MCDGSALARYSNRAMPGPRSPPHLNHPLVGVEMTRRRGGSVGKGDDDGTWRLAIKLRVYSASAPTWSLPCTHTRSTRADGCNRVARPAPPTSTTGTGQTALPNGGGAFKAVGCSLFGAGPPTAPPPLMTRTAAAPSSTAAWIALPAPPDRLPEFTSMRATNCVVDFPDLFWLQLLANAPARTVIFPVTQVVFGSQTASHGSLWLATITSHPSYSKKGSIGTETDVVVHSKADRRDCNHLMVL